MHACTSVTVLRSAGGRGARRGTGASGGSAAVADGGRGRGAPRGAGRAEGRGGAHRAELRFKRPVDHGPVLSAYHSH